MALLIRTYAHQGADHEIFSIVGEIDFLRGLKRFLLGSRWTKLTKWTHEFKESKSASGAIELSRQFGDERDLLKLHSLFYFDFLSFIKSL